MLRSDYKKNSTKYLIDGIQFYFMGRVVIFINPRPRLHQAKRDPTAWYTDLLYFALLILKCLWHEISPQMFMIALYE
jgi:hypothetical protein